MRWGYQGGRRHLLTLLGAGSVQPSFSAVLSTKDSLKPFERVTSRMRASYIASLPHADSAKYLASLSEAGDWRDVDYADRSMGFWRPMRHLERVRAIAVAWALLPVGSTAANKAKDAAILALRTWRTLSPRSDNWWHESIGQQLCLIPILTILFDQLPEELRDYYISKFYTPSSVPIARRTGQNLVWYTKEQLARGALIGSALDLEAARNALESVLAPSDDEGIQVDFSFHQHGPQLYSGGYGLGFLADVSEMAGWLVETPWQLSRTSLDKLAEYAVVGIGSVIRGDWLDWGSRGREFTRRESPPRHRTLVDALVILRGLSSPRYTEGLTLLAERLKSNARVDSVKPYSVAFWRSDFVAHQTSSGYFSVKMCSPQTIGTESANGENLLGYWMPFGATFFVRHGGEYSGLTPLLDWAGVPGVTCPNDVPIFQGYQRHNNGKAACASDGLGSVACMQLDMLQTRGRKAWFLLGDSLVALGAGIASAHVAQVRTTVNQTKWQGDIVLDGKVVRSTGVRTGITAAAMNGITYVGLQGTQLTCIAEDVRAETDRSNTSLGFTAPVSASIFTLLIDHGRQPKSGRYAYSVSFSPRSPSSDDSVVLPASILANTDELQAVRWHEKGLIMAVFHAAGSLPLDEGRTLHVSHPCVLLVTIGSVGQSSKFTLSCLDGDGPALTVTMRQRSGDESKNFRPEQTRGKAPVSWITRA